MLNYAIMRDDVVKKLFSSEIGKKYSASIIANVLDLDEEEVYNNLEYAPNYLGSNANVVGSEADLVFFQGKTIINIEFNNWISMSNKIKNETYVVQLYLAQLHSYKDYVKLKKIIQINIDNFDYFSKNLFLYHSLMMETNLHIPDLQNIEIYHINLQYLREKEYNNLISDKLRLEKLVYLLICEDKEQLIKLYERDDLMSKVSEEVMRIAKDMEKWAYYNREDLINQDLKIQHIHDMEAVAKRMLSENISIDIIAKCTGLTVEDINELKSEM